MLMYHVTFTEKVSKILDEGIVPGKKQTWTKNIGKFKKGYIYSFTLYMDAVRWAFKQNWEFKKPTSIVVFEVLGDSKNNWLEDEHPERVFGYDGDWMKSKVFITPETIKVIVAQSRWSDDAKLLTANQPPQHQSYFSWV